MNINAVRTMFRYYREENKRLRSALFTVQIHYSKDIADLETRLSEVEGQCTCRWASLSPRGYRGPSSSARLGPKFGLPDATIVPFQWFSSLPSRVARRLSRNLTSASDQ